MTNRNTRRAFLASLMALILCVSSLLGTTYAWFTDEVTSANNVITSGNLDISLEYLNKAGEWTDVEGSSEIFDENALWEPGYTKVVYLKVENEGTLALKYQLAVNVLNEVEGINKDGESFKLSDYIYMAVIESDTFTEVDTREAAAALKTESKLISKGYTKASSLTADAGAVYVTLIVYMPETVGNIANHNGTDVPVINLGLGVKATQTIAEDDSFGKDYDGAAPWLGGVDISWYDPAKTELTISSAEQLAGLAAIVNGGDATMSANAAASPSVETFAGKTITLTSDIDLANLAWTPIGSWNNPFEGTFDGQGYTISNLFINAPEGEGIGFFGVTQNATIKNVTLNNVDVEAYSMVSALVGAAYPANISDCHVTGDIEIVAEWAYVSGIAGYCYYGTQVDGCSVVADDKGLIKSETRNGVGGITAWLLEGDHKVTNCTVKNLDLVGWTNIGGITGFVHYNNTIDGCSVENVTLTKTREDGNPGIGLIAGGWSYSATSAITLSNNSIKNATLNGTHVAYSAYNELYGSEYGGATTANFVLDNNTTNGITNNLIEVKKITDVADLKDALTNGGKYVLAANLSVTETLTVPSGVETVLYMNGKTITGTNSATETHNDLFLVKGTLTVNGGTITLTHAAANMAWNGATSVFDVTAGGVLNLNGVTAENLGGTDMNFVAHLNNWGEVTLNVQDSTLKAAYCAVRVFNSGFDMNNVTIKNSTIYSKGNRAFWVHNYLGDLDSSKHSDAAIKARLNFDIFGNGNTYVAETNTNGGIIRYGFNTTVYYNADGKQVVTAATQDALNSAISANGGKVNVALDDGNYSMPSTNGDVTISGTKDTVITINKPTANTVSLKGVTVVGSGSYTGIQHSNTVVYEDCTVKGAQSLYASKVVFKNCVIDLTEATDYIWTYGAENVEFINCTFNTNGKALLIYNEGAGATNVTVKGCTFNATAGAKAGAIANQNCAAIEIDNFQSSGIGVAHTLVTENNTYSDFFSGEWRIKNYVAGADITVNGTAYQQIAIDGKLMTIDASKNVTVQ